MLKKARYIKNLDGRLFLSLLKHSKCLIGNSSVGIRECSFLGVPVVNIGNRQAGRMRSHNVNDVEWNSDEIHAAIRQQVEHGDYSSSSIYGDGMSGERIAELLSRDFDFKLKRFVD